MTRPKYLTARLIYELANSKGMTAKDLADITGLTPHTVRMRLNGLQAVNMVYSNKGGSRKRAKKWHINLRRNVK